MDRKRNGKKRGKFLKESNPGDPAFIPILRISGPLLPFFLITLFLRGAGLLKSYGYWRRKIKLEKFICFWYN
jgi:hypothetical protein